MDYSKLIKLGKKAYEMLKKDQQNRYSLLEPISYPPMRCDMFFSAFQYEDDYIKIDAIDDAHIQVTIKPFDGLSANIWDGTSLYPDADKPVFYASLLHDVLYYDMRLIAANTGKEECDIRHFADVAFANLCDKYGSNKIKNRLIYTILRFGGGLYHWMKELLLAIVLFTVASSCSSCQYPTILEDDPPTPKYEKVAQMSPKGRFLTISNRKTPFRED